MPPRSYTNADLARLARTSPIMGQPYDLSEPESVPEMGATVPDLGLTRNDADLLLTAARRTLDRADTLSRESGTQNLVNLPTRLASLSAGPRPSVSDAAASITGPLSTVGKGLMAGSLPASFAASPVAGGSLFAAGAALSAPDVLRRLLFPRQGGADTGTGPVKDEIRGGAALEAAGLVVPQLYKSAKAGFKAGKQAYQGAKEARRVSAAREAMKGGPAIPRPAASVGPSKFSLGREVPFAADMAPAVDPNQVVRVAQEVSAETGVPVAEVLKGYGSMGGSSEQMSALGRLVRGGERGRFTRKMREPGWQIIREEREKLNDIPRPTARDIQDILDEVLGTGASLVTR